jgi:hypothetical protein
VALPHWRSWHDARARAQSRPSRIQACAVDSGIGDACGCARSGCGETAESQARSRLWL